MFLLVTRPFINPVLFYVHLKCNQALYKSSVSSYRLIKVTDMDSVLSNPNLVSDFTETQIDSWSISQSIVKVNIFYESLSYTLMTESQQMDIVSLLASIGGNLGLFLGVSLFSLCEIVEVIIEMYYILKERVI